MTKMTLAEWGHYQARIHLVNKRRQELIEEGDPDALAPMRQLVEFVDPPKKRKRDRPKRPRRKGVSL